MSYSIYRVRAIARNDQETIYGPVGFEAAQALVRDLAAHRDLREVRLETASEIPGSPVSTEAPSLRYRSSTVLVYRAGSRQQRLFECPRELATILHDEYGWAYA